MKILIVKNKLHNISLIHFVTDFIVSCIYSNCLKSEKTQIKVNLMTSEQLFNLSKHTYKDLFKVANIHILLARSKYFD